MINPGLLSKQMQVPSGVASAVQNASARTGVDFSYLLKQAKVESSFDTDAKSKSSSATGLYQFIDQTWLRMVKEYGAEHGKADWADAIGQGKNGRFYVTDDNLKSKIMNGRKDPEFSALMAGELASENKSTLEGKLGRNVNATDLYMAHFMGAGGASTFLSAMQDNPLQTAATLFPDAAKANRGVFYNADGTARSLAEVYEKFAAKFGDEAMPASASVSSSPETLAARAKKPLPTDDIIRWNDGSITNLTADNRSYSRQGMPSGAASYTPTISRMQSMIGADLLASPLLTLLGGSGSTRSDNDGENNYFRALSVNG